MKSDFVIPLALLVLTLTSYYTARTLQRRAHPRGMWQAVAALAAYQGALTVGAGAGFLAIVSIYAGVVPL